MPRTECASVASYFYHALDRGNGRARVVLDADGYHDLVRL
jgi:hypothetical protein